MRYERISLINPPLDSNRFRSIDAGHWQPLNLLALASYLKENGYAGEIQILDQEILECSEIYEKMLSFNPDLIGISPNLDSYDETIKLASIAKSKGADVVLGGNYASSLSRNILGNRSEIDFVIVRDGENPLFLLANGTELESINNLVYRKKDIIVANSIMHNKVASLCEIDYSLVDLNRYFENYSKINSVKKFERPISFLSQRGCVWKDNTGGCLFCSREIGARFDEIDFVWDRIRNLKNKHKIDSIMDVSDDFLGNKNWFLEFHKNRPNDLNDVGINFIYSRVNHISEENAAKLKDLNTFEVFLGIESGEQEILKNTIKGNSINQQFNAVRRLENNDVFVTLGFVLGLPGETKKTLNATFEHIQRMLEFRNIKEIVVSIMTPLPGSPSYELMLNHEIMGNKYSGRDKFPMISMQEDWMKYFTNISLGLVEDYVSKINELSPVIAAEFIEENKLSLNNV